MEIALLNLIPKRNSITSNLFLNESILPKTTTIVKEINNFTIDIIDIDKILKTNRSPTSSDFKSNRFGTSCNVSVDFSLNSNKTLTYLNSNTSGIVAYNKDIINHQENSNNKHDTAGFKMFTENNNEQSQNNKDIINHQESSNNKPDTAGFKMFTENNNEQSQNSNDKEKSFKNRPTIIQKTNYYTYNNFYIHK